MSRLPLSTELGLVAFVLVFPIWMIPIRENMLLIFSIMGVQLAACIGSFVARHYERKAHRAEVQAFIDKVRKRKKDD